jgi:hypothetical protein
MISYYASGSIMNDLFGGVSFTPPANYYLALSTNTISNSGSNCAEPTGSVGYARVAIPNTKAYWTYSSSGSVWNNAAITFPQSSGSWGTIVSAALFDTSASATGNVWFFQNISNKIVQSATTVSFSASALVLSMTN